MESNAYQTKRINLHSLLAWLENEDLCSTNSSISSKFKRPYPKPYKHSFPNTYPIQRVNHSPLPKMKKKNNSFSFRPHNMINIYLASLASFTQFSLWSLILLHDIYHMRACLEIIIKYSNIIKNEQNKGRKGMPHDPLLTPTLVLV